MLYQLGVFGLGLFQDGDVGVGVFPKIEEVVPTENIIGRLATESTTSQSIFSVVVG
jgi:hypothetical protein